MPDSIPSPDNPTCQSCGLYKGCKTPFMKPKHSVNNPTVMIVGEAPGAEEDLQGTPFVGESGRLLRKVLRNLEISDDDVMMTNVVRCRPPDNKISKKHIKACKQFALDEIERAEPEYVLLMGNSPLEAVLGQTGITTWHGVTVQQLDKTYIPLFHPAYILRNMNMMDQWLEGFVKLSDLMDGVVSEDIGYDYIYPKTMKEIHLMLRELEMYEFISYDTETSSLDPFGKGAKVIAITMAGRDKQESKGKSWAFPFHHKDGWWTELELQQITKLLQDFVKGKKLIGHNMKFDRKHSKKYDIDIRTHADTMLISHLLDSRKGIHSLKRLAGLHLGMYKYDEELEDYKKQHKEADPEFGGSYENIPLEILLPYSCMDTHATMEIFYAMYPDLSEKQKVFHDEVLVRVSDILSDMEYTGMKLDDYLVKRYHAIYTEVREDVYCKLLENEDVIKMMNWYNDVWIPSLTLVNLVHGNDKSRTENTVLKLAKKLFDSKEAWLDDKYLHILQQNGKKRRLKRKFVEFNPKSPNQKRKLLFEYNGIPVSLVDETPTGLPSTKAKTLRRYTERYPILKDLIYYGLLSDMLSKYLEPALYHVWQSDQDHRVRSNYNLHGTRTGRLSSSDPNLQNIPTPEKEPGTLLESLPIKNMFTVDDDEYLISIDYSGMELRVFASLANCEPMLKIHESGMDFHSMVGILVSEKKPIHVITKEEVKHFKEFKKAIRYRYKWTNWTLLYGGSAYTLYNMYPDDFPDIETAKETEAEYYKTFPEVPEYMENCVKTVQELGYIESPFGRREYFPYLHSGSTDRSKVSQERREAVNMPVQSTASDTLLCSLIVIDAQLNANHLHAKLINTVHDSIVLRCPKNELKQVIDICVDCMEHVKDYAEFYFPNVDFSWLLSPLKADADYGTHYGAMQEYEG